MKQRKKVRMPTRAIKRMVNKLIRRRPREEMAQMPTKTERIQIKIKAKLI